MIRAILLDPVKGETREITVDAGSQPGMGAFATILNCQWVQFVPIAGDTGLLMDEEGSFKGTRMGMTVFGGLVYHGKVMLVGFSVDSPEFVDLPEDITVESVQGKVEYVNP
jgi:hypothetical protein